MPYILKQSYTAAYKDSNNLSAFDTVGIVPFAMKPVFKTAVLATKGKPCATNKLQLDVERIKYFVDDSKLDEAEDELMKQLCGSKFSTGKMFRHCCTDASFRMAARLKANIEAKNAKNKLEAKERSKEKAKARVLKQKEEADKRESDRLSFLACYESRAPPCSVCAPLPCKWAGFKLCPYCDTVKRRKCAKASCKGARASNPDHPAIKEILAAPRPARGGQTRKRARSESSSEGGNDSDTDNENSSDCESAGAGDFPGSDLIGRVFQDADLGECVVTEPGSHVHEGEEYDMLWYKYTDESGEEQHECSDVADVRNWVEAFEN